LAEAGILVREPFAGRNRNRIIRRLPTHSRLDWLATLLLLVGIGLFQLWAASHYAIFDDEAFSCRRYVLPTGQLVEALWHNVEPDPPLYYLAIHAWTRLLGVAPLALRSLSILFFLAGLLVLRAAGTAWFGSATGRLAMFLAALHPLHLLFGMAARWYSLMFLCVALLLWATARLRAPLSNSSLIARRSSLCLWILAAAAVCYTNYFGLCVVGLLWLACLFADRRDRAALRRWLQAALAVALLYAPWMPAFLRQATIFPRTDPSLSAYVNIAARTGVALATGNLADPGALSRDQPGAWWVWAPMAIAVAALLVIAIKGRRLVAILLWLTGGCIAAGILTLTMIDKYVMTFSAAACLLVAALLFSNRGNWLGRIAACGLALGWLGCYANLAREQDWSSQRWLDPIESVMRGLASRVAPSDLLVATHPAVIYYWGLIATESGQRGDPAAWCNAVQRVTAPDTAENTFKKFSGMNVWLIETSATAADASAIARLKDLLDRGFRPTSAERFAPDPTAAQKNRLDPLYRHPEYRIVIRRYQR